MIIFNKIYSCLTYFCKNPNQMTYLNWKTILFLFLISFTLLGQVSKKELTKLSYDELHNIYFANEKNQSIQLECAKAYLVRANKENIPIRKAKANYQFALLYYDTNPNKAIMYLDSVIKYSLNSNDKYFPAAAYCEKAEFLKKQFNFKEAMANYNLAEKIALKTNIDFYYNVRDYIGITKSEDLGQYNEALVIYKECFHYYQTKNVRSSKYSNNYQGIIFGIADCYKSLKNTDSTSYYNKLGYHESNITKDEEYKYLFILNEGANQVLKKNYKAALDSINKALPKMIAYNNVGNTLASYYYLGKTYDGLGNKTLATNNFIKVDSIYKITKDISTEFTDGYPYLINYYKNKGDKENQLKYLTAYMAIDSTLQKNYKELNTLVQKEYDTPHLFSEKETLIQALEKDKAKSYWGIGGLLLITISVSGFAIYQHRLKKNYRSRFEKIMNQTNITNDSLSNTPTKEIEIQTNNSKEDIGIAEELINQILERLKRFESKREYLQSNITVQILSTTFETNSKYVSKIINTHKGKTFIQYINDLRIEYAIIQLQKENKLQKYTIHALALEFGFNNAESFSTAFHKKTGIKPTYFIKELENLAKI
jgi:AraC-like DNA-binding protein